MKNTQFHTESIVIHSCPSTEWKKPHDPSQLKYDL